MASIIRGVSNFFKGGDQLTKLTAERDRIAGSLEKVTAEKDRIQDLVNRKGGQISFAQQSIKDLEGSKTPNQICIITTKEGLTSLEKEKAVLSSRLEKLVQSCSSLETQLQDVEGKRFNLLSNGKDIQ